MRENIVYATHSDIRKGQPGRKALNKNRDEERKVRKETG